MKVTVLGAGSWGTALAKVLADNHHQVYMWGRRGDPIDEINTHHTNDRYLPGYPLPQSIIATNDLSEAIQESALIVVVIPTQGVRGVMQQLNPLLCKAQEDVVITHASKGIEVRTGLRVSQIIAEELDSQDYQAISALSGPSHAEEVIAQHPTTIVAACESKQPAEFVQQAFMNDYFRVYTNQDLIGVELGGALKNIIAICSGIVDGLGYGDNTKAALMTRGLAEISRLGSRMGADPLTFSGLSGMGDLVVTCTSIHSRNFRAGRLLAQGYSHQDLEAEIDMVVEGVATCQVAYRLAQDLEVDMPIACGLYALLNGKMSIEEAVSLLMTRKGKSEASLLDHQAFYERTEL